MAGEDELVEIERAGWDALSASGDVAKSHYADALAQTVLFLLPGGVLLDDRAAVIDSMGGEPWSSYRLFDERVVELSDDSAVLAYRASATRNGTEYEALVSSTYVRAGGTWRLAVHQQTPLPADHDR
jgi:hypothetical protein